MEQSRVRRDRDRRRRQIRRRRFVALLAIALALGGIVAAVLTTRGGGTEQVRAQRRTTTTTTAPKTEPKPAVATRLHLPATLSSRTVSVPILMYHRIDALRPTLPELTRNLTVAPGDFAAQMRWLKSHGFHTITQQQLYDALERGKTLPPKPVLLTFDDGYRDVFGNASALIDRLGLHATAYVITGRISGPDASFLTWPLVRSLERRGFDIGSHTVNHVDLTQLSDSEALRELEDSRRTLERKLGHPVQWFAYPYGKEDARVVDLTRRAGYVLAVTTQGGASQQASAPLELHRYEVLDSTGVGGLASMLGQ